MMNFTAMNDEEMDFVTGGAMYSIEEFTNGDKLSITFKNLNKGQKVTLVGEFKDDVFKKLAAYDKAHGEKSVKIVGGENRQDYIVFSQAL